MVTDFVRNNVSLREIARRLEAPLQFLKKAEIEVHLAIAGAVEWTTCRSSQAARRLNRSAKELHLCGLIIRQKFRPRFLNVSHDSVDHIDHLFFLGSRRRGPCHGRVAHRRAAGSDDIEQIDARQP